MYAGLITEALLGEMMGKLRYGSIALVVAQNLAIKIAPMQGLRENVKNGLMAAKNGLLNLKNHMTGHLMSKLRIFLKLINRNTAGT